MATLFEEQVKKQRPNWGDEIVLALDPGETTGVAVFKGIKLGEVTQLNTVEMPKAAVALYNLIVLIKPQVVIVEDYRVYKWKTDQHAWAGLHTPRLIGALEYILFVLNTPTIKQSAQVGKGFCTDERLKEWGFYTPAKRHAMDAVRHGCQFLMFGDESWRTPR